MSTATKDSSVFAAHSVFMQGYTVSIITVVIIIVTNIIINIILISTAMLLKFQLLGLSLVLTPFRSRSLRSPRLCVIPMPSLIVRVIASRLVP